MDNGIALSRAHQAIRAHEAEIARLKAEVAALKAENYDLRLRHTSALVKLQAVVEGLVKP